LGADERIDSATDLEIPGREIFFKERAANVAWSKTKASLAASTKLDDLVAASGAFPGAFQPKSLYWLASDADIETVVQRKFVTVASSIILAWRVYNTQVYFVETWS
jgi:hypothetical protein